MCAAEMGDQEINFLQQEDSICRSLHHLSAACDHPCAAANPAKRHSPLQLQEPAPKRASPPSAAFRDFIGFKKLILPADFAAGAAPPPLRRTLSEPVYSLAPDSVSAPHPVFNRQAMAASGTPPRPPTRRNPSKSPRCGESPNAKRLKRMKERLREMEKWWNEVATEDADGEDLDSENDLAVEDRKQENEDDVENCDPSQEAVFVEKSGECLVLHFKCPCGSGYEILLSGNNCYYKLINF